ncbi:hypothetical protein P3T25_003798 [Paraburkholderia sp. GAS32]|jgi:hypothetical protein
MTAPSGRIWVTVGIDAYETDECSELATDSENEHGVVTLNLWPPPFFRP